MDEDVFVALRRARELAGKSVLDSGNHMLTLAFLFAMYIFGELIGGSGAIDSGVQK